jgi:hypothetical protein
VALDGEGGQADAMKDERGFRVLGSAHALIDDRISIPSMAPNIVE